MHLSCVSIRSKVTLITSAVALASICCLSQGWAQQGGARGKSTVRQGPVIEECKRCHDIKEYLLELSASPHAVDSKGKKITCDQCHTMHFKPITNYYARADYQGKKIFKPEDFDRRIMQKNARGAIPPAKCQACHKDLYKNAKGDGPISGIGRLCHDAYMGKNGATHRKCAGCHINIAHLPPFDRDAPYRADFAKKLAAKFKAAKKGGKGAVSSTSATKASATPPTTADKAAKTAVPAEGAKGVQK